MKKLKIEMSFERSNLPYYQKTNEELYMYFQDADLNAECLALHARHLIKLIKQGMKTSREGVITILKHNGNKYEDHFRMVIDFYIKMRAGKMDETNSYFILDDYCFNASPQENTMKDKYKLAEKLINQSLKELLL